MSDNPYFQNVVSEFIAIVLIIVFGWILFYFSRRRKLMEFFNVRKSKKIVIYLSNLRIKSGGALGIDGRPRSFGESAIPVCESMLVPFFQRLFNFIIPGVESVPGLLRKILVSDVIVEVKPSPLEDGEIDRETTFLAIGSPGYNIAAHRLENQFHTPARLTADNTAIEFNGIPPMTNPEYGFVQRVYDRNTAQMAFYVAGMSSLGTMGAAHYLAAKWNELSKKYPKHNDFCVVIRVTSADGKSHEVVLERG